MNEMQERATGISAKAWIQLVGAILVLILVVVPFILVLVAAWPTITRLAPWSATVLTVTLTLALPVILVTALVCGVLWVRSHAENKRIMARKFAANQNGAYPVYLDERNQRFIQAVNAELPNVVPEHYAPSIHNHNDVNAFAKMLEMGRTNVQEIEGPSEVDVKDIHIPTFRDSLDAGMIGPGQQEILICHEVVIDEETGAFTGELIAYHGPHEENSTNFLGGSSKSGKTTYMAHIGAQGALMNALYYVIDPHLTHPDKSIAKKLEALSHAFILPPAMTDREVFTVLTHARAEAVNRVNGVETPYSGRPIVFIVDEALALMSRAQRTADKDILALYRELAFFMRDLGTQYNKFGVNGIFASQYVTKDAFKLPGGNIDFRDGCQNQTLLRLPPNQAQAMRLIDKSDLPGIRKLSPGHGYMGFACGDVIRMASGNVTREDIEYVASLAQPSPDRKRSFATSQTCMWVDEHEFGPTSGRTSGPLILDTDPLVEGLPASEVSTSQTSQSAEFGKSEKYRFAPDEERLVRELYKTYHNIDKVLKHLEKGGRWHKDASRILREAGLL